MTDRHIFNTYIDYAGTPTTVDLADATFEALAAGRDAANALMAALDGEFAGVV